MCTVNIFMAAIECYSKKRSIQLASPVSVSNLKFKNCMQVAYYSNNCACAILDVSLV